MVETELPDFALSMSFNYNGSRLACTAKDKKLRILDSHTGSIVKVNTLKFCVINALQIEVEEIWVKEIEALRLLSYVCCILLSVFIDICKRRRECEVNNSHITSVYIINCKQSKWKHLLVSCLHARHGDDILHVCVLLCLIRINTLLQFDTVSVFSLSFFFCTFLVLQAIPPPLQTCVWLFAGVCTHVYIAFIMKIRIS